MTSLIRSIAALSAALLLFSQTLAHAEETLRQKIGQMVMVGFSGTAIDDSLRQDLTSRNLGGIILMGTNCVSPLVISGLTSDIRAVAQTPPFIAVDQEGGKVARLNQKNGYAATSSAYRLGTVLASEDSTAEQAAIMAGWLKDGGFTTDFAPVADVNVNPLSPAIGYYGRSFSSRPPIVSAHTRVFIDQLRQKQLITCLKHFPGHGSAGTDSHLTLPDITSTWADSELVPYRQLLAEGRVDMVMAGHLYNAKIDSVYPASLSAPTITGLLRGSIGYPGVVISDDFYNMKAITDNYGFDQTVVLAVNAGLDILLYVNDFMGGASLCRKIVDIVEGKVLDGTIPRSRIDDSYARIMLLKQQYQITSVPVAGNTLVPGSFAVDNYPNPFNPSTTVQITLPVGGVVTARVYDILGREVSTLLDGVAAAGTHRLVWNAAGRSSGVYFCRVEFGSGSSRSMLTRKLVLAR